MALPKRYDHRTSEPELQALWQAAGTYAFGEPSDERPVFSIDTPPPTVSGRLHLGHTFSYSHADFIARYKRMCGFNVFYPMGFDDNGLPTEHLVERTDGVDARTMGRAAFVARCRSLSHEAEREYEALFRRLGLSVDWRYAYRTIDEQSVRTAQSAFLRLLDRGLAYRTEAPTIWCASCGTAIASAELEEVSRQTAFYSLPFKTPSGDMTIVTTRPELLHACVAVFVHPEDERWRAAIGSQATAPLYGHSVPVLADEAVDPSKGSGAVMCCTFGDQTDVFWWRSHGLPLVKAIDASSRLTELASGPYRGLPCDEARERIVADLDAAGLLLGRQPAEQSVRVHDRCSTPAEHLVTKQWFVRLLDERENLLRAADHLRWHPPHMGARLRDWIENLKWDWCISRQRSHGVPFPAWTCTSCGEITFAAPERLPVDPMVDDPAVRCPCGGDQFEAETDVMDTWATSSLTPQIAGRWLEAPDLYCRVFPYAMRPQAHEIIRTWTFYTLAQSLFHEATPPWANVFISGWGILPSGRGKISKSRGGGAHDPGEMYDRYGADAVRFWSASTGTGKDALVHEDKIKDGARLVTKLWNVGRFAERFIADATNSNNSGAAQPADDRQQFSPVDRWILARAQVTIADATSAFESFDYAGAKSAAETFFWHDLADNYLELAKGRLYDGELAQHTGACSALRHALLTSLKLLAPFLPYVTESVYRALFSADTGDSIHTSSWPATDERWDDPAAEAFGETVLHIVTAVRRYKSKHSLQLGAELAALSVSSKTTPTLALLRSCEADLRSVTRASEVAFVDAIGAEAELVMDDHGVAVGVVRD